MLDVFKVGFSLVSRLCTPVPDVYTFSTSGVDALNSLSMKVALEDSFEIKVGDMIELLEYQTSFTCLS